MAQGVENKIFTKMSRSRPEKVFVVNDFVDFGSYKSCSKALENLTKQGKIARVSRGLYAVPRMNEFLGKKTTPSTDKIVRAIMKKENTRIIPTGSYAKNMLNLSTQLPMKIVYLTDGNPRKLMIGKVPVYFRKASTKNFATKGELSTLAIQALKTIRKDNVTEQHVEKIVNILKKENPKHLKHDMMFAPRWIREIMKKSLPQNN
jgi:hypothetical protein